MPHPGRAVDVVVVEQRPANLLATKDMGAQGFRVYANEWWHFDYQDWRLYPILNTTFDRIGGR